MLRGMRPLPVLVTLTVAALLLACIPIQRTTSGGVVAGQAVDRQSKVLLLGIADGVEEDGPAEGSGQLVYSAVRDQLIAKGVPIITTDKTDLAAGFEQAKSMGCEYVLRGMIPEWEDNATEWSGKPDVASVSLELYDAADQVLVATGSHRIKSSTAQMLSKRPDRYVPEIVDVALSKIYGWPQTVATK